MEEIDENNLQLSSKQISELVDLLEKEAVIENEQSQKTAQSATSDKQSGGLPKEKLQIPLPENAAQTIPDPNKKVPKTNTKSKTL